MAGQPVGYITEEAGSWFARQLFGTRRPFRALIMDPDGSPLLWVCIIYGFVIVPLLLNNYTRYEDHSPGSTPECTSNDPSYLNL
jgi:hypothetical protein